VHIFEVLLYHSQFLRLYIGQITQLQITEMQKVKNYPTFYILFLNFNLAKGGASAPLAPSLVAPLGSVAQLLDFDFTLGLYYSINNDLADVLG